MIEETISPEQACAFYDRIGPIYDFGERFERRAKARGIERLALAPGQRLLNVGVGTGQEQLLIQRALLPGGVAVGIDLSRVMLQLSRERLPAPANGALYLAGAHRLPFAAASFDRLFSSYMLDLIPLHDILPILQEFARVLRPDGRLVLVGLTEGTTLASRALMGAWKAFYRLSPGALGGCRPIRLTYPLLRAGFTHVRREVVVQGGMPSEVLVASLA